MVQRSVPAPFLSKTYQLVDDRSTDDVISWNQTGTTFVVWKTADFARDLLPKYFKHNNFSSFVRQLNTYGFRKTVPDKWEFANENFRRGEKELLTEIRRRKTITPIITPNQAAGKSTTGGAPSSSNSGEDLGSTSTSSPDSKNPGSVETAQFADLSDENEKLKRENQMLNTELSQTKKQCDELVSFLTQYLNVAPDQINRIVSQGTCGSSLDAMTGEGGDDAVENDLDDDDENEESLKLFGVWMKEKKKKRGRDENMGFSGAHRKELKTLG
ncbi:unnamed protein product [Ilex paraguariensis]|uniref:HSF-type DNA-binding domain-containing protein n=1 Tax=Ilex paraguariensis TaxID=185542 RepID=A0ABC8TF51_9AQUA